jgi:hypothetical protein
LLTISADFEARDDDVELAFALDLTFETVEESALEFRDFAATEARHVDVVALRTSLVKMFFALEMHEIEFVHEAVALEQAESAVDGDAVDIGIEFAGALKNLRGVEVLLRGFDDAQDRTALVRHAQSAGHEFGLEASGSFGLGHGHGAVPRLIETTLQL